MSSDEEADAAAGGETWLTRLTAEEWLRAATGELGRAAEALHAKQQRSGVAQARRAAGMAWNAVLQGIADPAERARYGRSYVDHLRALREDASVPAAVREAAEALVSAPLETRLVQLGPGDLRLARAAEVIVEEARRRVGGAGRS
jgi:hypothetical protein